MIRSVLRNIKNIPGWRTNRQIVVFESDDWGAIRMPSTDVYNKFVKKGFGVNKGLYNRFDSLENETDLTKLFETLSLVKDCNNQPAKFTANCIIANPDFDRIKAADYSNYYYELVTDSFKKYPGRDNVFALWKEGCEKGLFIPQSHGREHVNINRWMKRLQEKDSNTLFCFDHRTTFSGNGNDDYNYMEALDYNDKSEIPGLNQVIEEGLMIFKSFFGYSSKSFIAPSYIWNSAIEPTLKKFGVKYMQGIQFQFIPKGGFGHYKKEFHYMGEKNTSGQLYLIRNCSFEPTLMPEKDAVDACMEQVKTAFKWKKPAVITSHRLNYIGSLDSNNSDTNLRHLKNLLFSIQKNWPAVEFMSTDQLGDLINQ